MDCFYVKKTVMKEVMNVMVVVLGFNVIFSIFYQISDKTCKNNTFSDLSHAFTAASQNNIMSLFF